MVVEWVLMVVGMVVEALSVMVVVGIVDARSERLVDWEEMWDGMTPESVALLGVMVVVAETVGRPVEAKE
jgi:hypothetical protein